VGKHALVGASGEISDYNYILTLLDELMTAESCADDGHTMAPAEMFAYLTRVLYNRRNKFDPLWNSLVVAGVDPVSGQSFLGTVGMIGSAYTDAHVATGFGAHLARPLFREKHREDMSASEARGLLEEALRVCYYRDKNSINKFQVATITPQGAVVSEPFALATEWGLKAYDNPSGTTPGTW
jgi:20S proteasome subunit beta 7